MIQEHQPPGPFTLPGLNVPRSPSPDAQASAPQQPGLAGAALPPRPPTENTRLAEGEPIKPPSEWWPQELGAEKWAETESRPDYRAYLAMQFYQLLDWQTRDNPEIDTKFRAAKDVLSYYAIKKKMESQDPRVSKIEQDFDDEVRKYDKQTGSRMFGLLDELDSLEGMLGMVSGTRINPDNKDLVDWLELNFAKGYTERTNEATERRQQEIQHEIEGVFGQIRQDAQGASFLSKRTQKKEAVARKKKDIEAEKVSPQDKGKSLSDEIIHALRRNKYFIGTEQDADRLRRQPQPEDIASVAIEVLKSGRELRKTPEGMAEIEKARNTIQWYISKVRDYGILDDIDRIIEGDDAALRNSVDMIGRMTAEGVVFSEGSIKKDLRAKARDNQELLEDDTEWEKITRRIIRSISRDPNITPSVAATEIARAESLIDAAKGIRGYVAKRGYDQISERLDSRISTRQGMGADDSTTIEPFIGELDFRVIDLINKVSQEPSDELFYEPGQISGYVHLTGRNVGDLEKGVSNYIKNLLDSTASTDLETLLGNLKMLTSEIGTTGQRFNLSPEQINYLQDLAVNKVLLQVSDFQGSILHMDVSLDAGYRWADGRGDSRLIQIPTLEEGLVGIAQLVRQHPGHVLYYRPEGWKGQVTNDQETQRLIRSKDEEQMIEEIMEYELIDKLDAGKKALTECKSEKDFIKKYKIATVKVEGEEGELNMRDLKAKKALAERDLDLIRSSIDQARQAGQITDFDALVKLEDARKKVEFYAKPYEARRTLAKSAFDFATQVDNVLGESAERGVPSLKTENGDRVPIPIVIAAMNHAVRIAAADTQSELLEHGIRVGNYAHFIRWRAHIATIGRKLVNTFLIGKPEDHGLVEEDVNQRGVRTIKRDSQGKAVPASYVQVIDNIPGNPRSDYVFKLQKGFEGTGLTEKEFRAMFEAFREIRKHGFNASLEGKKIQIRTSDGRGTEEVRQRVTLADINGMEELRPMINSYLANDPHGKDNAWHPETRRAAAKGELPFFKSVYKRLEWFGLDEILAIRDKGLIAPAVRPVDQRQPGEVDPNDHNELRVTGERVVENCRSLDSMLNGMFNYFATRANLDELDTALRDLSEGRESTVLRLPEDTDLRKLNLYLDKTAFTSETIPIEWPGLNLGAKRFGRSNIIYRWLNQKEDFIARGMSVKIRYPIRWSCFSEASGGRTLLSTILNYNREILDVWQMQLHFLRGKAVMGIKGDIETDITDKGETHFGGGDKHWASPENLNKALVDPQFARDVLAQAVQEGLVNRGIALGTVEIAVGMFKNLAPAWARMADLVGEKRGARGSGADYEEMQKLKWIETQWALSAAGASGIRRDAGALGAHSRVAENIKTIFVPGTFDPNGDSVFDRSWEIVVPAVNREVLPSKPPLVYI